MGKDATLTCPRCGGEGKKHGDECDFCGGTGKVKINTSEIKRVG